LAESLDQTVRVVRRPHEGVGPARTAGVAASTGSLIAFLDADDVWMPRKLERQLAALDAMPSVDAVFCLMDEFVDGTPPRDHRPPRLGVAAPLSSAALLRRELVERVGPFPPGPVSDWVRWWARARSLDLREHVVPEVLFRRRIHGANNSARRYDDGRALLSIAREHLRARPKP
jgi:glycosyltransferase involved in cell wall biosynthesis